MVHKTHLVTRADVPLSHDAKVRAEAAAPHETLHHHLVAESEPKFVAGKPRLHRLEDGGADAEAIADLSHCK
jgi:hypothetical protein